ncbi:MAG TPA: group 1 truncated hemoglobin [Mycobacteriales bacterium]|nr:group 1 truncated hemoglobin [Mycobacteriales bacterium]
MSIYDAIGGAGAVSAAVDNFYVRVMADADLAPYFDGIDMAKLKAHQRMFISAALGGPEPYQGRRMAVAHAGLDITDAEFDAVVGHLAATLIDLGVDAGTIEQIAGALAPLRADIVARPQAAAAI